MMTAAQYLELLRQIMPRGPAWPSAPGAALSKLLAGLAEEFARLDTRVDDLITEMDPRVTFELLPDWERAYGLPEPCIPLGASVTERRNALVAKVTAIGGQSVSYFLSIAQALGYVGANWTPFAWQFINSAQGWTPANASVTPGATTILYASSAANPSLTKSTLAFVGGTYRYVIARLRRTVTSAEVWEGVLSYTTAAHAASLTQHKAIAEPAGIGADFVLAVWDMHNLTAGGTDWKDSIITGLKLELGNSNGNTYEIDWIAVSKTDPADVSITIDEQVDGLPHKWRMNAPTVTYTVFTCQSACDESLREWGNELLECVMNRYRPAHTQLVFGYGP